MTDGWNEGVQMSGGTMNVQTQAIGRGARAYTVASELRDRGQDDVARRLEELVGQLEAHADEVPDVQDVLDATNTVTAELAKERPSKTTVNGVLSSIAASVQSVSGLATAVAALQKAVHSLS